MITCECGLQYPYPELREVVCREGRHAMGYYQLALIGPANYMECAPCPCDCHTTPETDAMLEADAARVDPRGWVAADPERLAQAETAQEVDMN